MESNLSPCEFKGSCLSKKIRRQVAVGLSILLKSGRDLKLSGVPEVLDYHPYLAYFDGREMRRLRFDVGFEAKEQQFCRRNEVLCTSAAEQSPVPQIAGNATRAE